MQQQQRRTMASPQGVQSTGGAIDLGGGEALKHQSALIPFWAIGFSSAGALTGNELHAVIFGLCDFRSILQNQGLRFKQ